MRLSIGFTEGLIPRYQFCSSDSQWVFTPCEAGCSPQLIALSNIHTPAMPGRLSATWPERNRAPFSGVGIRRRSCSGALPLTQSKRPAGWFKNQRPPGPAHGTRGLQPVRDGRVRSAWLGHTAILKNPPRNANPLHAVPLRSRCARTRVNPAPRHRPVRRLARPMLGRWPNRPAL